MNKKETHFGYQTVDEKDKESLVAGVFDSVASKYDIMNDVMSLGIHRIWKKITMQHTGLKAGDHALDVAGGTGDLTMAMSKQVGPTGEIIISDINAAMLNEGRRRLLDKGYGGNIKIWSLTIADEKTDFKNFCDRMIENENELKNIMMEEKALSDNNV